MAAVRIEDVKAAGVAVDIDALAASGFASISEEDRYRLKTQGVCTQRQVGAFMLRIRIPGGKATPAQIRTVCDLSERFGHSSVHVTSRGGLELHHIAIENVPAALAALGEAGLTTKGTCGDTIRNVIACAHAGTYAGEVLPLDGFARMLHEYIVAISDATNISRKMNVAMCCSPRCDDHVATSDIGFVATPPPDGGAAGFAVWGAGGLGATPRLATLLAPFIAQADVMPAFCALVAMGEKYADRSSRAKAKIKLLVDKLGAERVREIFNEEFEAARARTLPSFSIEPPTIERRAVPSPRAGAVLEERTAGFFTIPALIPMGELATSAARALADAADVFGDGLVHLTPDQNAELHGVPRERIDAAIAAVESLGLRTRGRGGIADVLSCVGLEYCPLAVAHSMSMGDEIAQAFESRRIDERYADFRIHVSGCPHSCAKHQVADIGLAGGITEFEGKRVEAFALYLGGNAHERRLGRTFAGKIPRPRVIAVIAALLETYETHALEGERFSQTVARTGDELFFAAISSALAPPTVTPDVREGRLVVVGNGMAGARFIEEMRKRDRERFSITVFGDEPIAGYNRIMLSSALAGKHAADDLITHSASWYAEHDVSLHSGVRIASVDRARRVVVDTNGAETAYDALVIATGSLPLVPPIPGIAHPAVHALRTLADCERIQAAALNARSAIVLGGGLLGLEAASGLRARGLEVQVIHLAPWLMEQQLDREGGEALRSRVERLGITIRVGARVSEIVHDGEALGGVRLSDETVVPADLIVVCCGIVPNTRLAAEAGLAVERGVVVDDGLRTSDERVYAIGECVQHRGLTYGVVDPLWDQACTLADRLTGVERSYEGSTVGTRLKVAGINVVSLGDRVHEPGDEVSLSLGSDGSYRRAIVRDGKLIGAQVVGDPAAAAALARAFDRNAPLAGTAAAFVFGSRAVPTVAAAAPERGGDDDPVCLCNTVSRGTIRSAIAAGATDVAAIGRATAAGTGCGSCRGELAQLVIAAGTTSVALAPGGGESGDPFETLLSARLERDFQSALRAQPAERAHALRRVARQTLAAATLLDAAH